MSSLGNAAAAATAATAVTPVEAAFSNLLCTQQETARLARNLISRAEGDLGMVLKGVPPPADPSNKVGPAVLDSVPPTSLLREIHDATDREINIQHHLIALDSILDRVVL